jgi:hypothetical protein
MMILVRPDPVTVSVEVEGSREAGGVPHKVEEGPKDFVRRDREVCDNRFGENEGVRGYRLPIFVISVAISRQLKPAYLDEG